MWPDRSIPKVDFSSFIPAPGTQILHICFLVALTCRSSFPPPLFSTSISRQRFRKSRKTGDSFSGFCSSGVPLVAIRYNAWGSTMEHRGGRVIHLINLFQVIPSFELFLPKPRTQNISTIPTTFWTQRRIWHRCLHSQGSSSFCGSYFKWKISFLSNSCIYKLTIAHTGVCYDTLY